MERKKSLQELIFLHKDFSYSTNKFIMDFFEFSMENYFLEIV